MCKCDDSTSRRQLCATPQCLFCCLLLVCYRTLARFFPRESIQLSAATKAINYVINAVAAVINSHA